MTVNQFGVTAEDNDRLLELMGECRHEWVNDGQYARDVCSKCGLDWLWEDIDIPERPNVGQSEDLTLGEMVRLCAEMPHSPSINYHYAAHAYASEGHRVTLTWYPLDRGGRWAHGEGATPEAALAAAILAAVDAGKAKE